MGINRGRACEPGEGILSQSRRGTGPNASIDEVSLAPGILTMLHRVCALWGWTHLFPLILAAVARAEPRETFFSAEGHSVLPVSV